MFALVEVSIYVLWDLSISLSLSLLHIHAATALQVASKSLMQYLIAYPGSNMLMNKQS